jgi:hypothetical protein
MKNNRKTRNLKKMQLRKRTQAACSDALANLLFGHFDEKSVLRIFLSSIDVLKPGPDREINALLAKHFPDLTVENALRLLQSELLRQTLRENSRKGRIRLWGKQDRYRYVAESKRVLIKHYDGDIIITDPCYLFPHDSAGRELWRESEYGENLSAIGIASGIGRDTIYGDWSCNVMQIIKHRPAKIIGEFCADSGQVAVMLLSDALKLRPDFDYHVTKPWACCLIKNFKGSVQIKYARKARELRVIGAGNIRFYSSQSGF